MKEWILNIVTNIMGGDIAWTVVGAVIHTVIVLIPLLIGVAYLTYAERRVIGYMQGRIGPNRVGPQGLLQPFADAIKVVAKKFLIPTKVDRILFILAPAISFFTSLVVWAVIPFYARGSAVADINAGVLYILAITSLGTYGVIIAGWSSNSVYAFLGAVRCAAQVISYELAMGFALIAVLLVTQSLNISSIVEQQQIGWGATHGLNFLSWNLIPLFPLAVIYFIAGIAETHRHPFDMAEGESEIVAGFHVEYSGIPFALFFLSEYANMILVATLTVLMFLGGWSAPLAFLEFIPPFFWFMGKICFLLVLFLWIRATFPRYRYDQIMNLGWKCFIPLTLFWTVLVSFWVMSSYNIFWH